MFVRCVSGSDNRKQWHYRLTLLYSTHQVRGKVVYEGQQVEAVELHSRCLREVVAPRAVYECMIDWWW